MRDFNQRIKSFHQKKQVYDKKAADYNARLDEAAGSGKKPEAAPVEGEKLPVAAEADVPSGKPDIAGAGKADKNEKDQAGSIDETRQRLEQTREDLEREFEALLKEKSAIAEERGRMKTGGDVVKNNNRISKYNERVKKFEERQKAFNSESLTFNRELEGKSP